MKVIICAVAFTSYIQNTANNLFADPLLRRFSWNEGFHPSRMSTSLRRKSAMPERDGRFFHQAIHPKWAKLIRCIPCVDKSGPKYPRSVPTALSIVVDIDFWCFAFSSICYLLVIASRDSQNQQMSFVSRKPLLPCQGAYRHLHPIHEPSLGMPRRPRSQSRLSRLAGRFAGIGCNTSESGLSIRQGLARDAKEFQLSRIHFVFDFN